MEYITNTISYFYNLLPSLYTIPSNKDDFYYLALLKNKRVESGYQIHGLWSNYADGSYPTYCKKVEFDMEKLESIKDELHKYWPSYSGTAEHFYAHEYKKHGSCLFSDMTELEYFKKTIELYHYVIDNKLYETFIKGNQCLIPFDLEFKLLRPQ